VPSKNPLELDHGRAQEREDFHGKCCLSGSAPSAISHSLGLTCQYLGSLSPRSARRFEANAGTATDHDHGLLQEFRFPLSDSGQQSRISATLGAASMRVPAILS
jgi:hypothetical protein